MTLKVAETQEPSLTRSSGRASQYMRSMRDEEVVFGWKAWQEGSRVQEIMEHRVGSSVEAWVITYEMSPLSIH